VDPGAQIRRGANRNSPMGRRVASRLSMVARVVTALVVVGAPPGEAAERAEKPRYAHPAFGPAARVAQYGPAQIPLHDQAMLELPDAHLFIPRPEADAIMRLYGNAFGPAFVGLVFARSSSSDYVMVEYRDSGHVDDREARSWDTAAMLTTIGERTAAGNRMRRRLGGSDVEIVGWVAEPTYDARRRALTWSVALASAGGEAGDAATVNDHTIVLGRSGYVELTLMTDRATVDKGASQLPALMAGVRFNRGLGYAEFDRAQDLRAPFGLAALVSGDTDREPQTTRSLADAFAPAEFWPRSAATPIGSRFVAETVLQAPVERGRTLWMASNDGDLLLVADLPAVPDPEALFERLEAARASHGGVTVYYELADGALSGEGRPIAILRSIEHDGVRVTGMQGALVYPFARPDRPARAAELAFARGVAYLQAQRYETAIRLLSQALASDALSAPARSLALKSRGRARQYLVEDRRLDPTAESDRELLAALKDFRAWRALEPESLLSLDMEADALQSLGAYDEALAIYRRVRNGQQEQGGEVWPSIKIAATYRLMGDDRLALRTLDEIAARSRGWDGIAYGYHRGWTLVRLARYADAEAAFSAGLEAQPDFGWARVGRACARSAQGKLADALVDLETALRDLEPPAGVKRTPRQQRDLEETRSVVAKLTPMVGHPPSVPPGEPCRLFLDSLDRPRSRSPELTTPVREE
jgi:uncharacterized membrane-anchored protein